MSGVCGSFASADQTAGSMPFAKSFGSYAGVEAIARISPVCGSSATAEPARPANAFSIAPCRPASIVSVRLGPFSGAWRSASRISRPWLFTITRR